MVKEFGAKLGAALMQLINKNTGEHLASGTVDKSWVSVTCDAIGSVDSTCGPPKSAIDAAKAMIAELSNLTKHDMQRRSAKYSPRTKVDAQLLEAWRKAAGDPDLWIYKWLRDGAPAGITGHLKDPGIFPECHRPADLQPQDLHCDEQQFENYPGVEEQAITDSELAAHLAKGHIRAFDTYSELAAFVDSGEPILNKLGLIVKTRKVG